MLLSRRQIFLVVPPDVPDIPVALVVEQLVDLGVRQRDVVGVRVHQVSEVKSIAYVHEYVPATIRVGEGHVRVEVGFAVGRPGRLVR